MKTPDRFLLMPVFTGVLALVAASTAHAQDERGRVLSSTPIVQQVTVPREVCQNVTVREPARKSGAGALLGAVAGLLLGWAAARAWLRRSPPKFAVRIAEEPGHDG